MPIDPRGIAVVSGSGANWGDTKFRSLDNGEHYFSGSLTISSSIDTNTDRMGVSLSASGKVSASHFYGDGSGLTGITAEWDGSHTGDASISQTLTLGGGAASDEGIIFDGNAVDFYMGIDDSEDKLVIGTGGTIGTNPAIVISTDDTIRKIALSGALHTTTISGSGAALLGSTLRVEDALTANSSLSSRGATTLASAAGVTTIGSTTGATISAAGVVNVNNATDASNGTDGSLQTDGGLSVVKSAYIGANMTAAGRVLVDDTTEATSTTDGSLQTDGGLSVAKSAVIGDDLDLLSNSAIFKVGSDQPFTLTHANANNTLTATSGHRLAFGNAGEYITGDGTDLSIVSSGDASITGTNVKVVGALSASGATTLGSTLRVEDGLTANGSLSSRGATTLASAGGVTTIGAANGATVSAAGIVNVNNTTEATSTTDGSLQTDGGLSVAKSAVIGDDLDLLSDAAIVNFGADKDVTLTHVADTGLLLNSTSQLQFGDAGTYIHQSADGVLDLVADSEIEINATNIDINGAVDMSSNLTVAGNLTVNGTTTTINTTNLNVSDPVIALANGQDGGETPAFDQGIVFQRGSGDNAALVWDESNDRFIFANVRAQDATVSGNFDLPAAFPLSASAFYGDGSNLSGVGGSVANASTTPLDTDNYLQLTFVTGAAEAASFYVHSGSLAYNPANSTLKTPNFISNGTISGSGAVTLGSTLRVEDGLTANGTLSSRGATTLASAGGVTTIGAANGATVSAAGIVNVNNTTEATSTTDGSLQTDGGLSVAKSAVIGDDLDLLSNSAIFKVGSDQPFTLTHANANNTLTATSGHRLAFGDAGEYITGDGTDLAIVSSGDATITATNVKVVGALSASGATTLGSTLRVEDGLTANGSLSSRGATTLASAAGVTTIGSTTGATVSAAGIVNVNNQTEATSTTDGSLQTDGGLSVVKSAVIGDDLDLLSDGAILSIGSTSKFALTDQGANNTVMASSGHRLAFGNAGEYITGDGTDLAIVSSGDASVTATNVKVVGALSASGATTLGSTLRVEDGLTANSTLTVKGLATAQGRLIVDDTTEATSTTDGSLQTDGGLSVAKSAVIGDDLDLLSNSAIFKVGSDQPFTLTHANANNTLLASTNHRLAFGDAGDYIAGDGTDLKIVSSGDVDITGDTDVVGGLSSTQATTLASAAGVTTIGSTTGATISAAGVLNVNNATDATSGTDGSLQTDGGLSVVKSAYIGANMTVAGNLTVNGTTTTVNTTNLNVADPVIALANGQDGGETPAFDQGIVFQRGSGDNAALVWDESNDRFIFANVRAQDATVSGNFDLPAAFPLSASAFYGDGSNLSGVGGSVGNASTTPLDTDNYLQLTFVTGAAEAASFYVHSGSLAYNPASSTLKTPNFISNGTISGSGAVTLGSTLRVEDGLTANSSLSSRGATTLASAAGVTTIGSTTGATISAAGVLNVNNATEATTTTDGSLQTDGGLSVAKSAVIGDDLDLLSNSAIFKVGSDQPFTLTHANANNTLTATSGHRLAFGNAGEYITGDGTDLAIVSSGDASITATNVKVVGALSASGATTLGSTLRVEDALTANGALSSRGATTLASAGGVTTIGAANGATVSAAGIVNVNNTTEATSTTDGSLQTDGGLSVAKSAVIGDDLDLLSDSAILSIGSTSKFTLTDQAANNTVMAGSGHRLAFGNAGEYITGDGTDLAIVSSGDASITATNVKVVGALSASGATTLGSTLRVEDGLTANGSLSSRGATTLASAGGVTTIGAANGATISAAGIVNVNSATDATSTTDGSLQTDGGLSVAKDAVIGNDLKLLSDSAVLNFGADNDVNLTHTADTGIHLNGGMRLGFRDQGGEYIYSVADGTLGLVAATELDITATDIDLNGNVNIYQSSNGIDDVTLEVTGTIAQKSGSLQLGRISVDHAAGRTALVGLYQQAASLNGGMVYVVGNWAEANEGTGDTQQAYQTFSNGNKFYFCENGVWYPSPFASDL